MWWVSVMLPPNATSNAVAIGEGKWSIFVERPVSPALICIVVAVPILPRLLPRWASRKQALQTP